MTNLLGKIINYYRPGELYDIGSTKQIKCFFHGPDHTESARYYADTDSYYCFTCSIGGGPLWFIRELEECSTEEALKWVEDNFGITYKDTKKELQEIDMYERLIVDLVLEIRPKKFLQIYRELELAMKYKDLENLKFLFEGLKKRAIKDVRTI